MSEPSSSHESDPSATDAAKAEAGADPASEMEPREEERDQSRAANIVLYSPQRDFRGRTHSGFSSRWASRHVSRLVATAAIAAAIGAVSGALTAAGIGHLLVSHTAPPAVAETTDFKRAITQLDGELGALKANADKTAQATAAQLTKLAARLEKIDRAQDDTASRLAKIADAQDKLQDKLRTTAAQPTAAAPQQDVTGSIQSQAAMPPKTEVRVNARPAIVDGWVLDRVSRGGAIVASRSGYYEVYPGDPLPGIGPVEAVRYQDGRWVVVTPKGLIVKR